MATLTRDEVVSAPLDAFSSGIGQASNGRRVGGRWRWTPVVAVALYAVAALTANWPTWPGDPSRIRQGSDLAQMAWFLAWTPYAILHHHNIFFSRWINYPSGVNLAENTSAPLLGVLVAPLTLLVSPIASVNLLLWLAFPLSASSMFFVLRRWVRWDLAAFAGGALYGFSPYLVAQGYSHLDLVFVPLPPLILLAAYETLRPDGTRPGRWGAALGVLLVAQFFISPEIAATTTLVAAVAAAVLAVARPDQIWPAIRHGAQGLVAAAAIVAVCIAYPVWAMVAGPFRYHGPAYPGGWSADLLGTVAPTSLQHFAPKGLSHVGSKLLHGNLTESGSYLGLPLLLLMIVLVTVCWHRRWIRFAAVMALITTVLSLGSHLVVANHATTITLPWDLISHLPFANDAIVVRLSLYTALFSALLVALGADELHTRWGARLARDRSAARPRLDHTATWVGVAVVLGALAVVSLVPNWPFRTTPAEVPSYFSSPAVDRIPAGSVALLSPYPSVETPRAEMWQAVAGMRFRIIGGYALFASNVGISSNFPDVLGPFDVQRYLWTEGGGLPYPRGPVPHPSPSLTCHTDWFLHVNHVQTVISTTAAKHWRAVDSLFTDALGRPSAHPRNVEVWYSVPWRLSHYHPDCR